MFFSLPQHVRGLCVCLPACLGMESVRACVHSIRVFCGEPAHLCDALCNAHAHTRTQACLEYLVGYPPWILDRLVHVPSLSWWLAALPLT